MPHKIVVGFDGSKAARAAVEKALSMTRDGDEWEIVLVCTHERASELTEPLLYSPGVLSGEAKANRELWLKKWSAGVAEDMEHEVLRVRLSGVDASFVCSAEAPGDLILRVARQIAAESIVVVDDRSLSLLDYIFGSLVRRLLHDSEIPVVVVPAKEPLVSR